MNFPELIRKLRKEYAVSDENVLVHHDEISSGACQEFAAFVVNRAEENGFDVTARQVGFDTSIFDNGNFPSHAWIEYDGKYFDSDCPDGVDHPAELPYYQEKKASQHHKDADISRDGFPMDEIVPLQTDA